MNEERQCSGRDSGRGVMTGYYIVGVPILNGPMGVKTVHKEHWVFQHGTDRPNGQRQFEVLFGHQECPGAHTGSRHCGDDEPMTRDSDKDAWRRMSGSSSCDKIM